MLSKILHESEISMGAFDKGVGYDQGNKYERLETHDLNIRALGCDYKAHSLNITNVLTDIKEVQPETIAELKDFVRQNNAQGRAWGFKDPRTCLTYNVWKEILPEHKLVAIFRHPYELWAHYRRQKPWRFHEHFSICWKALMSWYVYNSEILKALKIAGAPAYVTEYHAFMGDDREFRRLCEFTGVELKDLRDKKMYRSKQESDPLYNFVLFLHKLAGRDVARLYNEMQGLARTKNISGQTPMRNKRPIFIAAFAYGGSNILLNLLRSHPSVCSPRGELNEVFKGKLDEPVTTRIMKTLRYLPIMIAERSDIFRFNDWAERRPFGKFTRKAVDKILFDEKIRAREEHQNLYKTETEKYTDAEIAQSRLLSKNLDGLIFVSRELAAMYPDAVFIGLVRNGFAVAEGHLRRGYDFETFVRNYERGCQRMLEDARVIPNYHVIRYEDILEKPQEMLKEIYRIADLDLSEVKKIRLQIKKVITGDGKHQNVDNKNWKEVVWHGLNDFQKQFRPEANSNQINRLTEEQKNTIVKLAGNSLRHFGYIPAHAAVER